MIKLKYLTIRNFLSIGNVPQVVDLNSTGLTLVLGENIDTGAAGSRNGVGKTTIINALSYALYGQGLTNIKRDNLINNINNKDMLVTLEFEINNNTYFIQRGRRPGLLVWKVNNNLVNSPDTDESEGDSKWTQKEIEKTIQLSHTLFKHIVALNTYNEPFLALKAADQRAVIEELLGITLLSLKAEQLKILLRDTKDSIKEAEITIKAKKESNIAIQKSIDDIERRSTIYEREKDKKYQNLLTSIAKLEQVDIDHEIAAHNKIAEALEIQKAIDQLLKDKKRLEQSIKTINSQLSSIKSDLQLVQEEKCPMCEQNISSHKHIDLKQTLEKRLEQIEIDLQSQTSELTSIENMIADAELLITNLGEIPNTFYNRLEDVFNHRNELENQKTQLSKIRSEENPYAQQVETLKQTGLQEISYDEINRLVVVKDHQEFLLKLLTDKGSFIRKKIIDQNLNLLNHRLSYYLDKLDLPHTVKFLNDLSVEITQLGKDLDFDNLSRGERNRLILSLSWAFRDVYESMNHPINLLFIDELLDSGLDGYGVETALSMIKEMGRSRNKSVFLISHREELISRCEVILKIKKENGFTTIEYDSGEEPVT